MVSKLNILKYREFQQSKLSFRYILNFLHCILVLSFDSFDDYKKYYSQLFNFSVVAPFLDHYFKVDFKCEPAHMPTTLMCMASSSLSFESTIDGPRCALRTKSLWQIFSMKNPPLTFYFVHIFDCLFILNYFFLIKIISCRPQCSRVS